jgi:hypothetical protein
VASRKVLKSVVTSLADSFASTLNYRENDYGLGHLLRRARELGQPSVCLDLRTGEISPADFADSPGGRSLETYARRFPELVAKHDLRFDQIASARMVITFDLSQAVPFPQRNYPDVAIAPSEPGSPYDVTVRIVDDRGREWSTTLHDWQYPACLPE